MEISELKRENARIRKGGRKKLYEIAHACAWGRMGGSAFPLAPRLNYLRRCKRHSPERERESFLRFFILPDWPIILSTGFVYLCLSWTRVYLVLLFFFSSMTLVLNLSLFLSLSMQVIFTFKYHSRELFEFFMKLVCYIHRLLWETFLFALDWYKPIADEFVRVSYSFGESINKFLGFYLNLNFSMNAHNNEFFELRRVRISLIGLP